MNTYSSSDSQLIAPSGPAAFLLVGAARILGEPFSLYRALGRRCFSVVRLHPQPHTSAAK